MRESEDEWLHEGYCYSGAEVESELVLLFEAIQRVLKHTDVHEIFLNYHLFFKYPDGSNGYRFDSRYLKPEDTPASMAKALATSALLAGPNEKYPSRFRAQLITPGDSGTSLAVELLPEHSFYLLYSMYEPCPAIPKRRAMFENVGQLLRQEIGRIQSEARSVGKRCLRDRPKRRACETSTLWRMTIEADAERLITQTAGWLEQLVQHLSLLGIASSFASYSRRAWREDGSGARIIEDINLWIGPRSNYMTLAKAIVEESNLGTTRGTPTSFVEVYVPEPVNARMDFWLVMGERDIQLEMRAWQYENLDVEYRQQFQRMLQVLHPLKTN
jgi:hypothetical protein